MENRLQEISLILLPIALSILLGQGLPDAAYGALLGDPLLGAIPAHVLQPLAVLSVIAGALLIYRLFPADTSIGWSVALLFILAPYHLSDALVLVSPYSAFSTVLLLAAVSLGYRLSGPLRAAALLPAAAGAYLLSPSFEFLSSIRGIGLLLPLSALSIWAYTQAKQWKPLAWFAASLVGAAIAFPLAIVPVVMAAAGGLMVWVKNSERTGWTLLVAAIIYYLLLFTGSDYLLFAAIAIGAALLFYLLLSLYSVHTQWTGMLLGFMLLVNLGIGYTALQSVQTTAAPAAMLEAWEQLGPGEVGILQFNNTFTYYTGRTALPLTLGDLLDDRPLPLRYVILSQNSLFASAAPTGRTYLFLQYQPSGEAVFIGSQSFLLVRLSPDEMQITEAVAIDRLTNIQRSIAFTKLRPLDDGQPLTASGNLLINTDGIEESNLYYLVTQGTVVFEKDGSYVIAAG